MRILLSVALVSLILLGFGCGTSRQSPLNLPTVLDANGLLVPDQPPGATVFISTVKMERLGWVVIQNLENEKPTNVIAAEFFSPGSHRGELSVHPPTEDGKMYQVSLYFDDGDAQLNLNLDYPVLDSQKQQFVVKFKADKTLKYPTGS